MRITKLLRVLVRGNNGQSEWKEITENKLPRGGKKLSFKQNAIVGFGFFMFLVSYGHFQDEINPDSSWAKWYRTLTREPMAWFMKGKENLPISPDHMPPVR